MLAEVLRRESAGVVVWESYGGDATWPRVNQLRLHRLQSLRATLVTSNRHSRHTMVSHCNLLLHACGAAQSTTPFSAAIHTGTDGFSVPQSIMDAYTAVPASNGQCPDLSFSFQGAQQLAQFNLRTIPIS